MGFEIGSEFEFDYGSIMESEPTMFEELFQTNNFELVSSGRCGIKQILLNLINDTNGKEEFLLPSYLCPSIVQAFTELNLKIVYYNVHSNLIIDWNDLNSKLNQNTKAVYFINYFGVLQPEEVLENLLSIKKRNICLIEDITHNFFSKRKDIGDYLVVSLRKWGPLPHGGLVIVNKSDKDYKNFYENSNQALRIGQQRSFGQQLKYLYLTELKNENLKTHYLSILRNMDRALYSHIEIVPMDELSKNLLKRMDFESLSRKRRENYKLLYEHLNGHDEFEIVIGDIQEHITPLGFHITCDNRDKLRKYLVNNGVYASVHWELPFDVQLNFKNPNHLSKRLLTIPCDQRYGQKEMEYIVELIKAYFFGKARKNKISEKVGEAL